MTWKCWFWDMVMQMDFGPRCDEMQRFCRRCRPRGSRSAVFDRMWRWYFH